jgi:hypothetical protein
LPLLSFLFDTRRVSRHDGERCSTTQGRFLAFANMLPHQLRASRSTFSTARHAPCLRSGSRRGLHCRRSREVPRSESLGGRAQARGRRVAMEAPKACTLVWRLRWRFRRRLLRCGDEQSYLPDALQLHLVTGEHYCNWSCSRPQHSHAMYRSLLHRHLLQLRTQRMSCCSAR